MQHTYFYQSLNWEAVGTYYDENGNPFDLCGQVEVVHNESTWTLGGFMEVSFETPVRFTNQYSINETDNNTTIEWESFNPALGKLKGTFEIIGNYIVSSYSSENGIYSGTETLIQIDKSTYKNVGVSFQQGKKMSSWTTLLKAKN